MWGRGLKYFAVMAIAYVAAVAPHVGAWIEILTSEPIPAKGDKSLPMWGRGLKLPYLKTPANPLLSLPMWGRGLKFYKPPIPPNGK